MLEDRGDSRTDVAEPRGKRGILGDAFAAGGLIFHGGRGVRDAGCGDAGMLALATIEHGP
jgi:hypothetical protein